MDKELLEEINKYNELTEDLVLEGNAREIVSKVQQLRKTKEFDVSDRIKLFYCGDEEISKTFAKFSDYIKDETLTVEVFVKENLNESFDINGHEMKIDLEKVNK